MVNRLCILLYFLSELGVPWCVEQPQSSLLELAPSCMHGSCTWIPHGCTSSVDRPSCGWAPMEVAVGI